MIIIKTVNVKRLVQWTGHHIIWLLVGSSLIAFLYKAEYISFIIPWLPVSVIGTAVAFYVGFKNNQAYERMWEARKIWGAIVNNSRSWGMYVDGFINNQFTKEKKTKEELQQIKQTLIYRHIAWLYALRSQLLIVAPWEHANQSGLVGKSAKRYQKKFGIGLVDDQETRTELEHYLPPSELNRLVESVNTATQIINEQSRSLTELRADNILDDFRHMEMERHLTHFYDEQGKCERIKNFPLPRQYAFMSRAFVAIFLFLLPFSLIPELLIIGELGFWLSIPITALVGWVYIMMEVTGDYSENPFQGMANDIPMLSLCRTIEIDLRQMLNEDDLPPPIKAKNGILM
jgi:putative membrane protein